MGKCFCRFPIAFLPPGFLTTLSYSPRRDSLRPSSLASFRPTLSHFKPYNAFLQKNPDSMYLLPVQLLNMEIPPTVQYITPPRPTPHSLCSNRNKFLWFSSRWRWQSKVRLISRKCLSTSVKMTYGKLSKALAN